MRANNKERLTRVILAAILTSDFTNNELQHLADEIAIDSDFPRDLSMLLKQIVDRLQNGGPRKQPSQTIDPDNYLDLINHVIQRRKLSRQQVLKLLDWVMPEVSLIAKSAKLTTQQAIEYFFTRASPAQQERFLSRLSPDQDVRDVRGDPYVRGIDRK